MAFFSLIYYEIVLTWRQAYAWATPLLFFALIVFIFSLTLGPDIILLRQAAPEIIWIASLLAILLSLGNLFRLDVQTGHIDILLLSPTPLLYIVLSKVAAYWLTQCLPLIALTPLLASMLGLAAEQITALVISLLLGTPVLCMLGTLGAAIMIGLRGQGLLLSVLMMPLYIPVLMLGIESVLATTHHLATSHYYALLGAHALFCLTFVPGLTVLALRNGVNQ